MATLNSEQKEQLLKQVQQQGLSISINQIAELFEKYDNLEVEDFAPPILPFELYNRLKEFLSVPQEVEAWNHLQHMPRREEGDVIRLIKETEDYISSFDNLRLSHVNEAYALLCDLQKQLHFLQQEKALSMQEEQRAWEYLTNMRRYNEDSIKEVIQETVKFLSCHPDSEHVPEAKRLLDELDFQMEEMRKRGPVTYIQKVTCLESEKSHKTEKPHLDYRNIWSCAECGIYFDLKNDSNLCCPICGGTLKKVGKKQPMGKTESPNCLLSLLKLPFNLICFLASSFHSQIKNSITSIGNNNGKKASYDDVFSSIFAPAEVKTMSHMQVQVYLHLYEEAEKVSLLAVESDKNAERRDYIPLQCKLKKGDKVDVLLNIYGETLLMSDKKSVVWQGLFTKCSFDYFVPKDLDVDELSCVALLSVNGVPVGEMRFITQIVEVPRLLNPEILAHKYNRVFISYSHQDESKVKFLHEGLELGSVPHFFDRKYLKAGDVFPQVIRDYINSADLFILCWSENASKSEYVQKERLQALERAFPQVRPEQAAKLRIYPMSIEPRAELPSDMKDNYHFGEI